MHYIILINTGKLLFGCILQYGFTVCGKGDEDYPFVRPCPDDFQCTAYGTCALPPGAALAGKLFITYLYSIRADIIWIGNFH